MDFFSINTDHSVTGSTDAESQRVGQTMKLFTIFPRVVGRWVSGGVAPGVCIPMHSAHLVGASSAHSPISEDKSRRLCARPPRPRPQAPHLAAATDPGPDHMGTQATGSSVP